jgi:hypothetical protein
MPRLLIGLAPALIVAVLLFALPACGGDDDGDAPRGTQTETTETETTETETTEDH